MAEFMTHEEARDKFSSKGVAGTALGLGIAGTALGLLGNNNGLGGILGLGNNNMAATAAGIAAGAGMTEMARREVDDHDYCLVREGQIQFEALKDQMFMRERDVAEKADIYRQTVKDNNRLADSISGVKEYATNGIVDAWKASNAQFRNLEAVVGENKLTAYKDMSDLYRATAVSDKNLELQIERNREIDQKEKFGLYKDLSEHTNRLAYETMKQSYEDRIANMHQLGALAARVSELEKNSAVTAAQLPLMFGLSDSNNTLKVREATCHKIDGHLTLSPCQISTPCYGGGYYSGSNNNINANFPIFTSPTDNSPIGCKGN